MKSGAKRQYLRCRLSRCPSWPRWPQSQSVVLETKPSLQSSTGGLSFSVSGRRVSWQAAWLIVTTVLRGCFLKTEKPSRMSRCVCDSYVLTLFDYLPFVHQPYIFRRRTCSRPRRAWPTSSGGSPSCRSWQTMPRRTSQLSRSTSRPFSTATSCAST